MKYVVTSAVILLSLLLGGAAYQWQAAKHDRLQHPAPGAFYEVDGLSIHLDCRGQGDPTLILEAGLTSGSSSWPLVHDALAEVTRTCAYDRPGLDWSDPIGSSQTASQVSRRLNKLLNAANIQGNKILVGMSAGGVYVREYYRTYPEEIVGVALVDSSHEQQFHRLPRMDAVDDMTAQLNVCRHLQPTGIVRAFNFLDRFYSSYDIEEGARATIMANMNQSHGCDAIYWELAGFNAEVSDTHALNSLDDLPLLVLSQGDVPHADEVIGLTEADAIAQRTIWNELQAELAALSTRSTHLIAEESGHVIQLEQPELMIDSLTHFVNTIRSASPELAAARATEVAHANEAPN